MSKYNMNKFERALIISIYKRDTSIEVLEENEYKLHVKTYDKQGCGGICEIVGVDDVQVKPYFDIDAKIELDKSFDETIIDDVEPEIKRYVMLKSIKARENQENMTEK